MQNNKARSIGTAISDEQDVVFALSTYYMLKDALSHGSIVYSTLSSETIIDTTHYDVPSMGIFYVCDPNHSSNVLMSLHPNAVKESLDSIGRIIEVFGVVDGQQNRRR